MQNHIPEVVFAALCGAALVAAAVTVIVLIVTNWNTSSHHDRKADALTILAVALIVAVLGYGAYACVTRAAALYDAPVSISGPDSVPNRLPMAGYVAGR